MSIKKGLITAGIFSSLLLLSGCEPSNIKSSFKQTKFNHPVTAMSFTNDGTKLSQIKSSNVTIKTDENASMSDPATLDVMYGQNKTVHQRNSLVVYSNLTNYADNFNATYNQNLPAGQPVIGTFYNYYAKDFDQPNMQDQTAVLVTSKNGDLVAAFVGSNIAVHAKSDDITIIDIDKQHIFLYEAGYATYPMKVLKSMAQDHKADKHNNQKQVKVVDDFDDSKSSKSK